MERKIKKHTDSKKGLKNMNSKSTDKRRLQTGKRENSSEHCPYAKKCGGCDYQGISYYADPLAKKPVNKEIDPELEKTFDKLGIPLEERLALSGVAVDAIWTQCR